MDIKFDKKTGRILSCTVEGKIRKAGDVLRIADDALPDDFMATFAQGKYLVQKGKIVKNKAYRKPKDTPPEL